jgi:hypothetical protein
VKANSLLWLQGAPVVYLSSPGVERSFCGRCGTPLTYRHERRPDEIDVTIGSLDHPGAAAPVDHIWMVDATAWDRPADGLPQHATVRGR